MGRDTATLSLSLLPDTAAMAGSSLTVGGCRLSDLASEFGTPLYVYDEQTLWNAARHVLGVFSGLGARVSFASKACEVIAVLRVFREAGLDLDVVSRGEMEAARRAGFRPGQLHLHGNCKSEDELREAVAAGIHAIVVDNAQEMHTLVRVTAESQSKACVHFRLRLPVEAETHPHLQTSGESSKFGIPIDEASALAAELVHHPAVELCGLHAHLGSQITDAGVYGRVARKLVRTADRLSRAGGAIEEIGIGGGWAVAYRPGDRSLSPEAVAEELGRVLPEGKPMRLAVEPGRALVARAAVALYRVGSVKQSVSGRVVAVDGGMGDNPRPALYGARYHALLVERPDAPAASRADIAGRYCESGDFLARDVPLPQVGAGDLVCITVAGAYQLSMASSYNLVPQPAAVMVSNGTARLIVRRATVEELFAREVLP